MIPRISGDERVDELFSDDWRDPGDDTERAGYLVGAGLALLVGLGLVGAGIFGAATGSGVGLFLLLTLFGLLLAVPSLLTLRAEWRRANETPMTADRMVAGGFLAGLALAGIGFAAMGYAGGGRRGHSDLGHRVDVGVMLAGALIVGGGALALATLLVGLVLAFGGGRSTNREIAVATVLARYAVTPGGECAQEHPAPEEDGLEGWITFRGVDGRKYDFRATPGTYARAYEAADARVTVRRGVIVAIRRPSI